MDRFIAWVEKLKSSGRWKGLVGALAVLAAAAAAIRLAQRMKAANALPQVQEARAAIRTLEQEKASLWQQREVKQAEVEAIEDKIKEQKATLQTAYRQEGMSAQDISRAFMKLGY